MYEELVKSLREKAEFLTVSDVQKAPPGLSIKNQFAETMSEAADVIDSMCEMVADAYSENANLIASYEDRLRWIPVTERLPEEKISPMTMDYTEYPCVFDGRDGQREVRYYKFGKGHFWHGPGCIDEYVTHWAEPMPLPEPPKGEDHD